MKKYVVQQGDTMWSISEATGVKPNLLLASNPQVKNPNQLRPGTIIVVPELKKSTLPPLNAKPGLSVNEPVPQTIAPTEAEVATVTPSAPEPKTGGKIPPFFGFVWPHVVQPGETWESIQTKYNVSGAHLEQLNPSLRSRGIRPGDLVYVPGMIPDALLAQLGGAMPQAHTAAAPNVPGYGAKAGMYGAQPGMYGAPGMQQQSGIMPAYPVGAQTPAVSPEVGTSEYPQMGPHEHNPYRGTEFDSDTFAWPKQGSSSISVYLGESSPHVDNDY